MQENDPCFTQTPALPQEMCGPHLKCERSAGSSQAFCKPLNTPCENARKADLGFLQKPPECDAEGNFKPTQVSLNNYLKKSWARENRKILNLPILPSNLDLKTLKLKSYAVNLIYRRFHISKMKLIFHLV